MTSAASSSWSFALMSAWRWRKQRMRTGRGKNASTARWARGAVGRDGDRGPEPPGEHAAAELGPEASGSVLPTVGCRGPSPSASMPQTANRASVVSGDCSDGTIASENRFLDGDPGEVPRGEGLVVLREEVGGLGGREAGDHRLPGRPTRRPRRPCGESSRVRLGDQALEDLGVVLQEAHRARATPLVGASHRGDRDATGMARSALRTRPGSYPFLEPCRPSPRRPSRPRPARESAGSASMISSGRRGGSPVPRTRSRRWSWSRSPR
jgi:hypothetical protein